MVEGGGPVEDGLREQGGIRGVQGVRGVRQIDEVAGLSGSLHQLLCIGDLFVGHRSQEAAGVLVAVDVRVRMPGQLRGDQRV